MASINTNVAALTALRALTTTNASLQQTQDRISTGLRVGSASDNAAYWSIATTMRSDYSSLSTVQDALGLGAATIDVAYTAIDKVKDTLVLIRDKLTAAAQPGLPRDKIQTEVKEMLGSLQGISDAATLQGQNWLSVDSSAAGYSATKKVVASISRAGGTLALQTIAIDTSTMVMYDANAAASGILDSTRNAVTGVVDAAGTFAISTIDISALSDSSADMAILDGYIKGVDNAITQLTAGATTLGAAKARIDIQQTFVTSLKDALEGGISQLVDADMNEESTRLQALQVKQQLGIQALSIANGSGQSILRLFQ
jgi:flagellin